MVRFTASLSGALDRLADTPMWSMTPEEERVALVELRMQRARLDELELRLLVQADRDGVGAESGAVSTPAWLAHATEDDAPPLGTGTCTWPRSSTRPSRRLGRRFAAGLIDVEKAAIVTAAVEALTASTTTCRPAPRPAQRRT